MTSWRINGRDVPAAILAAASEAAGPLPSYRAVKTGKGTWVFWRGRSYVVELARPTRGGSAPAGGGAGDGSVVSPMPGKIFKLLSSKGDAVKAGQELVILEAMKMEHALKAPRDGYVTELKVVPGELVEAGQVLAVVR